MGRVKVYELKKFFKEGKYSIYKEDEFIKNWDNKQKSNMIESLLLNIPMKQVILNEYKYSKYEMFDGREMVKSILEFLSGEFKLEGLEIMSKLNGLDYENLPREEQEYFYRKYIPCIHMFDVSENMRDNVFKRFHS